MADQPSEPAGGPEPTGPEPTGMPLWAKVFLIVLLVVILAFVISLLAGVQHGPGLHTPDRGGGQDPGTQQGP
jgi:hypothetical protein